MLLPYRCLEGTVCTGTNSLLLSVLIKLHNVPALRMTVQSQLESRPMVDCKPLNDTRKQAVTGNVSKAVAPISVHSHTWTVRIMLYKLSSLNGVCEVKRKMCWSGYHVILSSVLLAACGKGGEGRGTPTLSLPQSPGTHPPPPSRRRRRRRRHI